MRGEGGLNLSVSLSCVVANDMCATSFSLNRASNRAGHVSLRASGAVSVK